MATMAPAITESLNAAPTKKLSNEAVSVSTSNKVTALSASKNKNTKTDTTSNSSSQASVGKSKLGTASSSELNKIVTRERRSRTSTATSVAPTTRITRRSTGSNAKSDSMGLKSAKAPNTRLQASLENTDQPENQNISAQQQITSNQKQSSASTTNNNNNSNKNSSSETNNKNKDTSTEQLIADLTTDFEEAITAEICLRKQLLDVKVTSPDTVSSSVKTDLLTASPSASGSTNTNTSRVVSSTVELSGKACGSGGSVEDIIKVTKLLMDEDPDLIANNSSSSKNETVGNKQTRILESPVKSTITLRSRSKVESVTYNDESAVEKNSSPTDLLQDTVTDEDFELSSNEKCTDAVPTSSSSPSSHEAAVSEVFSHPQIAPGAITGAVAAAEEVVVDMDAIEEHLRQLDGGIIPTTPTTTITPAETTSSLNTMIIDNKRDIFASSSPSKKSDCRQPVQHNSSVISPTNIMPSLHATQLQPQQLHHQQQQQHHHQNLLGTTTASPVSSTSQANSSLIRDVGSATAELEDQDIEEVLKALKGFDSNTAAAENMLGDLNSFFNDVYTTLNCDEIVNSATNNTGIQQHNIATTPHPSVSSTISTVGIAAVNKPTSPLKELQIDIEKKEQVMQRKIDFLLRRLRKMQMRYMAKHASEEIAGLFEYTTRLLSKGGVNRMSNANASNTSGMESIAHMLLSSRPPVTTWSAEMSSTIPTAHLITTLRRIESAANAQQLVNTKNMGTVATSMGASASLYASAHAPPMQRKSKKAQEMIANSGSTTPTSSVSNAANTLELDQKKLNQIVPNLDSNFVDELIHVSGMLRAELREVQTAIDSDATESSSGGESADEMVSYNNQFQQSLSISKRAAWRFSRDRAAIASRWSWLLSQIADLEIKIRQHNQLYQEVRRAKGHVRCDEEIQRLSESKGNADISDLDLYQTSQIDSNSNETEPLDGSCRTRGFANAHFRKRKLLQTTNIHTILKKAARPSTIKCDCQCPLNSCAVCTGRIDPTAPRDLPDTMILSERVALLDPGYHSVLSFKEDINDSIHFEAISRMPDWQHRVIRSQPKSIARSVWKAERDANYGTNQNSAGFGKRYHHGSNNILDGSLAHKRKYIKRKEKEKHKTTSEGDTSKSAANFSASAMKGDTASATATPSALPTPTTNTEPEGLYGNGTAILSCTSSTTTSTPLVANKMTPASSKAVNGKKKMHVHLVGDGVLLEPMSLNSNNSQLLNSSSNSKNNSDYPQQRNSNQFNHSQTHSLSISSNNNNNRSSKSRRFNNNANIYNQNHSHHNNNNNNNYNHSNFQNINGDLNFESFGSGGGGGSGIDSSFCRSRTSSPTHTYYRHERSLERRNRSSYDIDNIVIPYSVAAATRVEILPYKEIPTPKWRILTDTQGDVNNSSNAQKITEEEEQEGEEACNVSENSIASKSINESSQVVNDPGDCGEMMATSSTLIKPETTTSEVDEVTSTNLESSDKPKESETKNEDSNAEVTSEENVIDCKNNSNKELISVNDDEDTIKVVSNTNEITSDILTSEDTLDAAETKRFFEKATPTQSQTDQQYNKDFKFVSMDDLNNDNLMMDVNEDSQNLENPDEVEDISDEAIIVRHERALIDERKKFQTYLKFPWSTRSRANRRIDSRAESSGANTPDPASPAPNTPLNFGGDQESIPSPMAPSTPLTPLETISETNEGQNSASSTTHHSTNITNMPSTSQTPNSSQVPASSNSSTYISNVNSKRRRTISVKKEVLERERRSSTPDLRELPPITYEPLSFPLSDEVYQSLLSSMFVGEDPKDLGENHKSKVSSTIRFSNNSSYFSKNNGRIDLPRSTFSTIDSSADLVASSENGRKRRRGAINNNASESKIRRHSSALMSNSYHVTGNEDDEDELGLSSDDINALQNNKRLFDGKMNASGKRKRSQRSRTKGNDEEARRLAANMDEGPENNLDLNGGDIDCIEDNEEDDDDGYQKHHLAPPVDIDDLDLDDGCGGSSMLGVSDPESSEEDPFHDDEDDDPEWKRGNASNERVNRKRL